MSTKARAFINRHPVPTYFAWGGVLGVVGPSGFPGTPQQFQTLLPIVVAVMIAGPSISGLWLTGLIYGRAGFRELSSRLRKWRVSPRWYAVALLIAPVLMLTVLLALSIFSRAGIFEELGWTGFAIPELRRRYGTLATGVIMGVAWAFWHLLVGRWASGTVSGNLTLASYMLDPFLFLAIFRILMVWVYDCTESLFVVVLMRSGSNLHLPC